MTSTIITIIGVLISCVAAIVSLLAFLRNRRKDEARSGENHGVIMSDIGYIKAGVDDLKTQSRETADKVNNLNERVTRCEESCKQAHHRIDELKGGE